MTFDQWWSTLETREQHRADKALTEEAFAAGASSRDAEIAELVALLTRYRKETPIGHQPHMISHLVDEALAKVRKPT